MLILALMMIGMSTSDPQGDSGTVAVDSRLETGTIAFDLQKAGPAFLEPGHTRLTFGGGVAWALESDDESTDYNLFVTWSRFLVQDIEIRLEGGLWYFDQEGDTAFGFNPSFTFRWHLIKSDPWTIFADAGIGVLLASDDVPSGGTSFNFMPRAGGGVTYRLNDVGHRLELGVRWHHVSNARVTGDSNNPDRDGVMVYAGFSIPFN